MKPHVHVFSSNLVQRNRNALFSLTKAGWIVAQLIGIMAGLTKESTHVFVLNLCRVKGKYFPVIYM